MLNPITPPKCYKALSPYLNQGHAIQHQQHNGYRPACARKARSACAPLSETERAQSSTVGGGRTPAAEVAGSRVTAGSGAARAGWHQARAAAAAQPHLAEQHTQRRAVQYTQLLFTQAWGFWKQATLNLDAM